MVGERDSALLVTKTLPVDFVQRSSRKLDAVRQKWSTNKWTLEDRYAKLEKIRHQGTDIVEWLG